MYVFGFFLIQYLNVKDEPDEMWTAAAAGGWRDIALLLHYSIICNNDALINVLVHVLYDSRI